MGWVRNTNRDSSESTVCGRSVESCIPINMQERFNGQSLSKALITKRILMQKRGQDIYDMFQ